MNQLPNLNQFLEEIDPEGTIDRKKAATEISVIVLLEAAKKTKGELPQKNQEELTRILQDKKDFSFEKIYELFKKAGKQEDLTRAANESIDKVKKSYLKTHLEAMSVEKREKVLSKFPSLKPIILK